MWQFLSKMTKGNVSVRKKIVIVIDQIEHMGYYDNSN